MNTRRQFLIKAPLGFLVASAACNDAAPVAPQTPPPASSTAGAPPTFGTGAGAGPVVTPETFAEAEKLMQLEMTVPERQQAASTWRQSMAQYLERRTGPRKVALVDTDVPATVWNPLLPGIAVPATSDRFVRSPASSAPLPTSDDAIAFAPVTELSRWIESRQLSSERLTQIYLARIDRLDGKIRSVITITRDHALMRAKTADAEIAAGRSRGPSTGTSGQCGSSSARLAPAMQAMWRSAQRSSPKSRKARSLSRACASAWPRAPRSRATAAQSLAATAMRPTPSRIGCLRM